MNRAICTLISVTVVAMILTATGGCTDQMLPAEGGTPTNVSKAPTIVFTSRVLTPDPDEMDVASTNLDGTVRRDLRAGQIMGEPAGGKVLFVTKVNDSKYALNITTIGKNDSTLIYMSIPDERFEYFSAAISPDGQRIAFGTVEPGLGASPDDKQIVVCNADGKGRTYIDMDSLAHNSHLTFSPDGMRLAFYGDDLGGDGLGKYSGTAVYIMSAFGGEPFKVADSADGGYDGASWLAFSPDGNRIVYTGAGVGGQSDIFVVNVDGSGRTNLTNDSYGDHMPSFSPDGTKIVWCGGLDSDIQIMNADGSGRTNLTESYNEGQYLYPQWSPDNRKIIYTVYRGDPYFKRGQLKTIDVATHVTTPVANDVYRGFWIK